MATRVPIRCHVVNETTAAVVGLPLLGGGGPWCLTRAGLPHSLASELQADVNRTTLASFTERLITNLDPRKKGSLERPPRAHFERHLTAPSSSRNPADRVALLRVAKLIMSSEGPLGLPDAVRLYIRARHRFLCFVKEHHFSA
jgi:hypothetical protein